MTSRRSTSSRSDRRTSSRMVTIGSRWRSNGTPNSSTLGSPASRPITKSAPTSTSAGSSTPSSSAISWTTAGWAARGPGSGSSSPFSTVTPKPARSSRPTATTSPERAAHCPHPSRWLRAGTTRSTDQQSRRLGGHGCRRCTPRGTRRTVISLWLYQIRRDLLAMDAKADFDAAAQHARLVRLGWRRKRIHLRDGRRPLPRKPDRRQLPGDEG